MIVRWIFFFVVFLTPHILIGKGLQLNGILIEGLDYSGKSTICSLLKEHLENQYPYIKHNHRYLGNIENIRSLLQQKMFDLQVLHKTSEFSINGFSIESPSIEELEQIIKKNKSSKTLLERCHLYTAHFLIDLDSFNASDDFFLQDRSWLSLLYANEFVIKNKSLASFIRKNHISFKWNVLLTIDPATRYQRSLQRDKQSLADLYLLDHPEIQKHIDIFLAKELPEDENWLIIDTSQLKPKELVEKILEFIKENGDL